MNYTKKNHNILLNLKFVHAEMQQNCFHYNQRMEKPKKIYANRHFEDYLV